MTPIGLVGELKESLYGRETCLAPRHVDASRDFYSNDEQQRGGVCAARLCLLFAFPCSADHEQDWPLCKVVFSGWPQIR